MLFNVRYYPKQTRYFSYVMIIATTFTVCLAYRHYRNTRFVQSWSLLTCTCYVFLLLFCVVCFVFLVVFFFSSFVLFFLLQMIAIIFDGAIYLFIYFLHFISLLLRPSPILKTIQKMGERNEKKTQQLYNSKQIIIILPMKYERRYHNICWGRGGLVVNTPDSRSRGRGFEPHLGRRVVSLSKIYIYPPKVLVIPRKRWLRPNMAEKLFTGTLSFKQTKNNICFNGFFSLVHYSCMCTVNR